MNGVQSGLGQLSPLGLSFLGGADPAWQDVM